MTEHNQQPPAQADQEEAIELSGVRTHNLKDLDVTFAKGKITAVMGVSGSGKSSLVFTTLYGEAFNRFLAIQKGRLVRKLDHKLLPQPVLKSATNLPAAIALRQHLPFFPQRATVGSYSAIFPVLRRLIASEGQRSCPACGETLRRYTPHLVAQTLAADAQAQAQAIFAAPVPRSSGSGVSASRLAKELLTAGFSRYVAKDASGSYKAHKLAALTEGSEPPTEADGLAVVVDKTALSKANTHRIEEAASLGYRLAGGELLVIQDGRKQSFFAELSCLRCQIRYPELTSSCYNPATPEGSCPACHGIGWQVSAPHGVDVMSWWQQIKAELTLGAKEKRQLDGLAKKLHAHAEGLQPLVAAIFDKDDSDETEALLRQSLQFSSCTACGGSGIRPESLATTLFGIPFGDWLGLSLAELHELLTAERLGAAPAGLIPLYNATATLVDLRLGYLSLSEPARHLSGGEVQRIGLAKVLASDLHDCLICLDEPSACLHPADVETVLGRIKDLAQRSNTVVVVDHHPLITTIADHTLYIGPFGGVQGGTLVTGLPSFTPASPEPLPEQRAELTLSDIRCRYFKGQNVTIPMAKNRRRLAPLVGIAGMSGSGKSTLVKDVLIPCLAAEASSTRSNPLPATITLPRQVAPKFLGQKALGRSSRSTLLTYLGLAAPLRKAFAAHPEARRRGYTPAHFNPHRKEGTCERCGGTGRIASPWQPEDSAPCPECGGHGFKKALLDIKYLDLTIVDIPQLTLTDALTAFADEPEFVKALEPLATFGLGYLTLGQATASYSGGQAQRLRLARLMRDVRSEPAEPLVILDEPSLGLSPYDVAGLIRQFQAMAADGITVIIVEHNLDILRCCQWLIELGPGAGPQGSQVIYQGPREDHPRTTPLGAFL